MKIIGAGFGRTGTTSLKAALERLGFDPCYHMTEVFAHPAHADFWVAACGSPPGTESRWIGTASSVTSRPRWTGPHVPSTKS